MTHSSRASAIAIALLVSTAIAACSGPPPRPVEAPAPAEPAIVDAVPAAQTPPTTPADDCSEHIEAAPVMENDHEAARGSATPDPDAPLCERYRALRWRAPIHADPPIPCERLDSLIYYSRDSAGTCGPTSLLRVYANGDLELERTGATCGPSSEKLRRGIEAKRAREILSLACGELNGASFRRDGAGCGDATHRLHFMTGDEKLADTMALPCGKGPMAGTEAAMTDLLSLFE